jgi:hypothetical protein
VVFGICLLISFHATLDLAFLYLIQIKGSLLVANVYSSVADLRIRDVLFLIPDPDPTIFSSRIPDPNIFHPRSYMKSGMQTYFFLASIMLSVAKS